MFSTYYNFYQIAKVAKLVNSQKSPDRETNVPICLGTRSMIYTTKWNISWSKLKNLDTSHGKNTTEHNEGDT